MVPRSKRPQNFGQQQIRNRAQLISGRRMSGHIHTQAAQLLNQPPDFGAVRGNFLRDLGAAHDDGGVLHQQAHDAAEANVGGLWRARRSPALAGPRRRRAAELSQAS